MRERPSSRLLVIDPFDRVLLFLFDHKQGALAGQQFWATPGGAVDEGESYAVAACRELQEETGLIVDDPGPEIARRVAIFPLVDGEMVRADERFFLVRAEDVTVSRERWTELEHEVMAAHRWFSASEVATATEKIYPEDLTEMLVGAGVWRADG